MGAYTYQMAHALAEAGHDVEVVSLRKEGETESSISTTQVGSKQIIIHRAPWTPVLGELKMFPLITSTSLYTLKTSFALWNSFLKRHLEKPFEVAEVHEHLAAGVMPLAVQALPVVVKLHTPHSMFISKGWHGHRPNFDNQVASMLERMSIVLADEICSPSQDVAQYVANDLRIPLDSITIVRNPVDTDQFSPEGEVALPPHDGPRILFVGRLEERKGITYLIEAVPKVVAQVPSAQFVFVGDDTNYGATGGSVLQSCKDTLQKHGCLNNALFVSQVKLDAMPTYYRAADVCAVPSLYDNAPYTCIEAMACGRAIVGTATGGIPEYIQTGRNGLLVEPRNPQALADAIVRLIRNAEERTRLGTQARIDAISALSKSAVANQMISLYQRAIEKHAHTQKFRLYSKDQSCLVAEATQFLHAYDQMIYDYLYQNSWRFRIQHWQRVIAARGLKYFFGKALLRLMRPFARLGSGSWFAETAANLETSLQKLETTPVNQG
jgi:glycosyltransferase involved in cell wall biosynthesis